MRVEDPAGNRLTSVVLQVIERDPDGQARTLRYLHDDETVDLAAANAAGGPIQFLIVWMAARDVQTEVGLPSLMEQIYSAKAKANERDEAIKALTNDVAWVRGEQAKLTVEIEAKTAALRQLQRERDPERIEREVSDRVSKATADLDTRLLVVKQENAQLRRDADELRASKKRLREALDRAKP